MIIHFHDSRLYIIQFEKMLTYGGVKYPEQGLQISKFGLASDQKE
jgi:hypothetical protein